MRQATCVALAAVLVGSGACGPSEPSGLTPEDLREIDLSPDHTITVDADGFDPTELEITAGEVVLLVNEGDDLHSFTAEERFDTGRMEPGEETTLVLTEPGAIPYVDLENPDAEGTLTILEAPED